MYKLDRVQFVTWAVNNFKNQILYNCIQDIALGNEFITSAEDLLDMCKDRNIPIPGICFTPNEPHVVNPFMVDKIVYNEKIL